MCEYRIIRLLLLIPTLYVVTVLAFIVIRFIQGNGLELTTCPLAGSANELEEILERVAS